MTPQIQSSAPLGGNDFRRLYRLGRTEQGAVPLTRWSNYSSIDLILNEVLLWLEGQYEMRMWQGGFWNTHDVLMMMHALQIDVRQYLPGVLHDIQSHYKEGSYDGVMGPTCGLLALLNTLAAKYKDQLLADGFGKAARVECFSWILANFDSQSIVGKQVAAQALLTLGSQELADELGDGCKTKIGSVRTTVRSSLDLRPEVLAGVSEIDLIRLMSLAIQLDQEAGSNSIVLELHRRQDAAGKWVSVGRTAHVLVGILENLVTLRRLVRPPADIDAVLFQGVEFIRSQYDPARRSWGGSIQDTARCLHVLGLYDRQYHVSSQDFFDAIAGEGRATESKVAAVQARRDIARLVARDNSQAEELEKLKERARKLEEDVKAASAQADSLYKRLVRTRSVAVTCTLIFVAFVLSLAVKYPATLKTIVSDSGSWIPIIVGAMLAVPVALWYKPKR